MRCLSVVVITILITVLSQAQTVSDKFIRPLPSPARAVVDFGRLLTKQQVNTLAKDLKAYQQQTSNAIVILTLESLTHPETEIEYSIEAAATDYFNSWGIGDSIRNNGVLILVVPSARKVRIEVGMGLEDVLTNDECAQIIKEQITPQFREQQYYQGLKDAVAAIKQELAEDALQQEDSVDLYAETERAPASFTPTTSEEPSFTTYSSSPAYTGVFVTGVVLFIVGILIFNIVMKAKGRSGGYYSDNGYHTYYDERRKDYRHDHRHRSYSSSSSSDDSSSSSSGSYSGGHSSGGGASGSW